MKTATSKQIVTTSPLAVLQPPPTKSEILDAMVSLQIERNLKAKAENAAKVKELTPKAEAAIQKWFLKNIKDADKEVRLGDIDSVWDSATQRTIRTSKVVRSRLTLSVPELPESLAKMVVEIRQLEAQHFTTEAKDVKRKIMDAMRGGNASVRVETLLASSEARKALEAALDKAL